jgi:hypothetical protein
MCGQDARPFLYRHEGFDLASFVCVSNPSFLPVFFIKSVLCHDDSGMSLSPHFLSHFFFFLEGPARMLMRKIIQKAHEVFEKPASASALDELCQWIDHVHSDEIIDIPRNMDHWVGTQHDDEENHSI